MNRAPAPFPQAGTRSRRLDRLLYAAGLDFDVLLTLLFRSWTIFAGGATALLVPTFLSPSQQGYYYTFSAVLATQVFFELGLNHVLVQLTSHAAAHLRRVSETRFEGDVRWRYAIASLLTLSSKWNSVMASIFFVALLFGGVWLFSDKGSLPTSQWMTTWVVLIGATAVNLAFSARLAICEGLGEVGHIARLRLRQSIAGYSLLWLLLAYGAGLWATAAVPIVNAIGTVWWLSRRRLTKSLDLQEPSPASDWSYSYRGDVFPLQWRIALSWVSGFFIFNFLTPIIFVHQGEVAAGRIGLGLTIFTAISTIGYSWISAATPSLSAHIARKERAKLNSLFKRQATRGIGATLLCAGGFLVAVQFSGHLVPKLLERLPPMPVLLLLFVTTVVNTVVFSMAAYMRAHKEEPMLAPSMVSALLIGAGAIVMAQYGLIAVVSTYVVVNVTVTLPWCVLLFVRYQRRVV